MVFSGAETIDEARSRPASVIILTGFLGAGKTTLLNRILTADHGRRIAVIVNEFGEVGIDHHLLIASVHEVVEMSNGCICCQVRGDLMRSLFALAEHRSKFDTVVIETTGLAEPAPVAQTLYADERIRRAFVLDGVITVVDAKHIGDQLEESAEACEQIAFADVILLNKTDLATPEVLAELEGRIGALNQVAKIHRTRNSDIDLSAVFDVVGTDPAQRIHAAIAAHDDDDLEPEDHDHHHHGHNHLRNIATISIVEACELDRRRVSLWLRSLAASFGADILRMKGILNLHGDPDQFWFQGVRMEYDGRPGRPWAAGEERANRLVFIGRNLDRDKVRSGFETCRFTGAVDASTSADPFLRLEEISPLRLDQIRYWMRQNFAFATDVPIVIKEVPCIKPGCPPIETAIVAILKNEPPRYFKIQRPIDEVTFDHVYDLMENPMPCC